MRTPQLLSILATVIFVILVLTGQIDIPDVTSSPSSTKGMLRDEALTALTASSTATYKIVRVIDADTLVASIGGMDVTLRLIGINTPEVVDPRKPVECFGREASDRAKKLLTGQSIGIALDVSQGTYDTYNRLLAYVYLEDGTFFNKAMVADGYAHEYTYNLPYQFQSEFKAAETDARVHGRGLWSPSSCNGDPG